MIFFTSDLHIGHANTLKFDKRPFKDTEEMDFELIKRWNNKVKANDTVYILGDFIWHHNNIVSLLNSLNGKKVLIMGNHDHKWLKPYNRKCFEDIKDTDNIVVTLKDGTQKRCVLSHYFMPFYNGHFRGSILLHGHSHNSNEHNLELEIAKDLNKKGFPNIIINVGCMLHDFEPKTLDELLDEYNKTNTL